MCWHVAFLVGCWEVVLEGIGILPLGGDVWCGWGCAGDESPLLFFFWLFWDFFLGVLFLGLGTGSSLILWMTPLTTASGSTYSV